MALLSQPAFSLSLSVPCLAPAACAVRPTVGVGARIHAMELVHDDEVGDVVVSVVRLLKGVYQLVSTIAAFFKVGPMRSSSHSSGRGPDQSRLGAHRSNSLQGKKPTASSTCAASSVSSTATGDKLLRWGGASSHRRGGAGSQLTTALSVHNCPCAA